MRDVSRLLISGAAIAAILMHASGAGAWTIDVNTTETSFPPPNGNCSIYEALALYGGGDSDACFWAFDGQDLTYTIKLMAGTYVIQEGVSISGITVAGSGVGNTTLQTNGFPNTTAVVLSDGALKDLTVKGQSLVATTRGIYNEGSSTITNVRVSGFNGSGIQNGTFDNNGTPNDPNDDFQVDGFLQIFSSTIDHNSAPDGGGGLLQASGQVFIHGSSINNNNALHGGGVNVKTGQAFVDYSTIAFNRATAGKGGGVHAQPSDTIFAEFNAYHVTIAYNSASQSSGGGGVFVEPSTVYVSNKVNASIIAKNTSGNNVQDDYRGRLRGANLGYQDGLNANLLGTNSNPAGFQSGFDIVSSTPGLATALANNGGPTQNIALNSGSPAINASQNPVTPPGTAPRNYDTQFHADQRGVSLPRPSPNQRYDLGAYER